MEAARLLWKKFLLESQSGKQLLADANKLMADARIKGMKAVASRGTPGWLDTRMQLIRSSSVPMDNISFLEVDTNW